MSDPAKQRAHRLYHEWENNSSDIYSYLKWLHLIKEGMLGRCGSLIDVISDHIHDRYSKVDRKLPRELHNAMLMRFDSAELKKARDFLDGDLSIDHLTNEVISTIGELVEVLEAQTADWYDEIE